ncbi:MAG: hypothetical protein ACOX2I_06910 [Candidatus Ozemobacteraceae bacterium]
MNKKVIVSAIAVLTICMASTVRLSASGSGLILPMPGQQLSTPPQQPQKATDSTKTKQPVKKERSPNKTNKSNKINNPDKNFELNPDKVFIPLPEISKDPKTGAVKIKKPTVRPPAPIIVTPAANRPKPNVQIKVTPVKPIPVDIPASSAPIDEDPDYYPVPSNEITVTTSDVAPPMITTEAPQIVVTEDSGELTVFPKDTGSAIFMVMKSWKCDDYDAGTLLEHAVGVYAGEADDPFQIKGIPAEAQAYDVTIEEEDITLDELLDIVAQKAGRDWGVDMNSRIIYFYPSGVRSNSYDLW